MRDAKKVGSELVGAARDSAVSLIDAQRARAAEQITAVGDALRSSMESFEASGSGALAQYANQAAEQQASQQAAYDQAYQQGAAAAQQQTQYAPAPEPAPAPAPAAAPSAGDDMMAQLTQLSQLHNAGVLSDEEFTAAKAKLLA